MEIDRERALKILWSLGTSIEPSDNVEWLEKALIADKRRSLIRQFAFLWCVRYVKEREVNNPNMAHMDWGTDDDVVFRRAQSLSGGLSLFWTDSIGEVVTRPSAGTGCLGDEAFSELLRDVNEMMAAKTREELLT